MPRNSANALAPIAQRTMPEPTLRNVFEDYKRFRKIKAETLAKYEVMINRCIPDWWERNLNRIGKEEILERHLALSNRNGPRGSGKIEANKVFVVLRAIFRYAQGRYEDEYLEPVVRRNPVVVLNATRAWNKSDRRTSYIPKQKMALWFAAVQRCKNHSIRDYLTFVFLTGCRRTEAVSLQWEWIDFNAELITFPKEATKNGLSFVLPLSRYLLHLLNARKELPDCDPKWVFWGAVPGKHLSNHLKFCSQLYRETGFSWSVHDLRRTFATVANNYVSSDIILKRLLNHSTKSSDVTAGYICQDTDSLREQVEIINAKILEFAGYKYVSKLGLVRISVANEVEQSISEDALLAALGRLPAEKLKAALESIESAPHLSIVS